MNQRNSDSSAPNASKYVPPHLRQANNNYPAEIETVPVESDRGGKYNNDRPDRENYQARGGDNRDYNRYVFFNLIEFSCHAVQGQG